MQPTLYHSHSRGQDLKPLRSVPGFLCHFCTYAEAAQKGLVLPEGETIAWLEEQKAAA